MAFGYPPADQQTKIAIIQAPFSVEYLSRNLAAGILIPLAGNWRAVPRQ
jgi:hypothetical protein